MMGAGMSGAMLSGMTWTVSSSGSTFSGSIQFPGFGGSPMTVSGTMNGHTGTFTMTAGTGSMMSPGMMSGCTATATGTLDMDDLMDQMHGTYSGTNTCTGPFNHGDLTMMRR